MIREGLRFVYRSSPRDLVNAVRRRLRGGQDGATQTIPAGPEEGFLRSRDYAELMARHLPYDGRYDEHEAQNETRNYRFRHHGDARRLGVFRWRGMQKHLDTLLPLLTRPKSKVVDFGGAAGPLGFDSLVVDQLQRDAWGREVRFHSLDDVGHDVDVLFSSHALEHIPQLDSTLRAMERCLKQGGHLILHLPSFHCERWRAGLHKNATYNDHVWTFGIGNDPVGVTCQSYVDIVGKVGQAFEIDLAEYCGDDSILIIARRR